MEFPLVLLFLPALISISSTEQEFRCGLPHARNTFLIVSGQETRLGLWPWHVALFLKARNGKSQYACGGTLISRRYVLTAAHCVVSSNPHQLKRNVADVTVKAGVYNINHPEESQQEMAVRKIHMNGYSRESFLHDIALLELQQPVEFNKHVLPACLNQKATLRSELGTVVGWGYGENERTSPILKKLTLPVVTETECLKSDPLIFKEVLNNELFCAGYANGSSPCNGDSGGGLVMQQGDAWHVTGIVSFTKSRRVDSQLCHAESYTAFTNVSAYWDWIENVTNIDFRNVYNEENNVPCTTPAKLQGSCVPLQQCKDIFNHIRAPVISQEDASFISASICKISGIPRAVCCKKDEIEPLPLHPNALLLPADCGRSLIRSNADNKQATSVFEFPWMAMVRYQRKKNGAIPFCLGTLINQRYVLSMIGCMNKIKKVKVDHIRLGEHTEPTDPDCVIDQIGQQFCARPVLDVKIESIVYHPLFDVPVYNNDVALIRMVTNIVFSDSIQPVCLPLFSPHRSAIPEELFMTAWEMNLNMGNVYRGELRRYPSKLVSIDECQKAYEDIGFIPDPPIQPDRMCSLPLGPEFNCELTPGAPIGAYVEMNGKRFVQFGQWKFAPQNCTFRSVIPNLAMNMGYYLQWILENIAP